MPLLEIPRNDDARIIFLQRALIAAESHKEQGHQYISDETIERIFQFLPSYETAITGLKFHRVSYYKRNQENNSAIHKLELYIRDLWEVLKRRVVRQNESVEVLTYYQLPITGIPPKVDKAKEWLDIAYRIILGDTAAQNKGFPAMINPSVKELHKILEIAERELINNDLCDVKPEGSTDKIENIREEANKLIMDVIHELRFNLRKNDANIIRQIMAAYGASFSFFKGEPVE